MSVRTIHNRHSNKTVHSYPKNGMKNIFCTHCKGRFCIRDLNNIGGQLVPLIRHCGHAICENCAQGHATKPCSICKNVPQLPRGSNSLLLPVNVYIVGLMCAQMSRPVKNNANEKDFTFRKSLRSQIREIQPDNCVECGSSASSRCIQCQVLYCSKCFVKFHAFQASKNHTAEGITLSKRKIKDLSVDCIDHPCNKKKHWCNDCKVSCCSDCVINSHRNHSTLSLTQMNMANREEFVEAYNIAVEILQKTDAAKKKVDEALHNEEQIYNVGNVEKDINQHFVYLHGVLQNIEEELMRTIDGRRNHYKQNLTVIQTELQKLEDQIREAILTANLAKEQFDCVNHASIIEQLKEFTKARCHFIKTPVEDQCDIGFYPSSDVIVKELRKHLVLEVSQMPEKFYLLSEQNLPSNYQLEPIEKDKLDIPKLYPAAELPPLSPSPSNSSLSPFPSSPTSGCSAGLNGSFIKPQVNLSSESQISKGIEVIITYIEHPQCFYIREKSDDKIFQEIQEKLELYKIIDSCLPNEVEINEIYIVLHGQSHKWYRGRIVDKRLNLDYNTYSYDIFDIDQGSKEYSVSLTKLREVNEELLRIPSTVREESLFDIVPMGKEWTPESKESMEHLIECETGNPILYYIDSENKIGTDILIPSPTTYPLSVRDALIFLGHGKFISKEKLFILNPISTNAFTYETLPLEQYIEVAVLHVETPNCFYVQKVHHKSVSYDNMIKQMTEDYRKTKKTRGLINNPDVGMNIVAPIDNYWYRGVITKILENKSVEVFFVDLGTTFNLHYKKIRKLDSRYARITPLAIKVSLKDVKPAKGQWSIEVNHAIIMFMEPMARILIYEKKDDCYIVDVINQHNETLTNHLEVNSYITPTIINVTNASKKFRNHNKKKKTSKHLDLFHAYVNSLTDNRNNSVKYDSFAVETINKPKAKPQEIDPFKVRVNIEKVVSPDEIYVSKADSSRSPFQTLHEIVNNFYTKNRAINSIQFKEDLICVAFITDLKGYYRVKIIKYDPPNNIEVELLDMKGTKQTVSEDKLQSLHISFFDTPIHSLKVKLGGILPCGGTSTWQSTSCAKLQEIITENQNCEFFITKVSCESDKEREKDDDKDDDTIMVDLYVKQTKIHDPLAPDKIYYTLINRVLVEEGLALPIKNYDENKSKISLLSIQHNFEYDESNEDNNFGPVDQETKNDVETNEQFEDPPHNLSKSFPPNKISWLPPEIFTEKKFIAFATYVDWDGFVYLHSINQNSHMIKNIENELNNSYQTSQYCPAIDSNWAPGDMCIAKFRKYMWGRAVVHEVKPSKIALEFVDYGTMEWQNPESIRKNICLQEIPRQCTKCKIWNLSPGNCDKKWTDHDLQVLHYTLVDKQCVIEILSVSTEYLIISVELMEKEPVDLITHLTQKCNIELNCSEDLNDDCLELWQPNILVNGNDSDAIVYDNDDPDVTVYDNDNPDDNDDNDTINNYLNIVENENSNNITDKQNLDTTINLKNENYRNIAKEIDYSPEILEKFKIDLVTDSEVAFTDGNNYMPFPISRNLDVFRATISEVDPQQPNLVWLHPLLTTGNPLINFLILKYQGLSQDLTNTAVNEPMLTDLKKGDPCVALYHDDNFWYRCTIINSDMDKLVQVQFVDWGNTDWVSCNDIRKIKPSWLGLPKMAIKCKLWNTRLNNEASGAREWLKKASANKDFVVYVQNATKDLLVVQLFRDLPSNNQTLFYQSLIDQGLFSPENSDY